MTSSIRDFVKQDLRERLFRDAWSFRVFNETDLQVRAAFHIQKRFLSDARKMFLVNEPSIKIGRAKGVKSAYPDLVLVNKGGPFAAIELKCFLEEGDSKFAAIENKAWEDIENLDKFCDRYGDNAYGFGMILVNLKEPGKFSRLKGRLDRDRESWMKHRIFAHVVNMYCD